MYLKIYNYKQTLTRESSRRLYILYSIKRAIHSVKRALYSIKRALNTTKRASISTITALHSIHKQTHKHVSHHT